MGEGQSGGGSINGGRACSTRLDELYVWAERASDGGAPTLSPRTGPAGPAPEGGAAYSSKPVSLRITGWRRSRSQPARQGITLGDVSCKETFRAWRRFVKETLCEGDVLSEETFRAGDVSCGDVL